VRDIPHTHSIRRRLYSDKWKQREGCCTVTGQGMTGHASRPRHMSPEELEEGYAKFTSLFACLIWRRRPEEARGGATIWRYLTCTSAQSFLAPAHRHHLVHAVWRPLVELTRVPHAHFAGIVRGKAPGRTPANVVSAGVSEGRILIVRSPPYEEPLNVVAAIGLALGGILGLSEP
jgi:hypothetical protein